MRLSPLLFALIIVLPAVGCSPITISNNAIALPADSKVTLTAVEFDYAKWSSQDAEFLEKMKNHEAKYRQLITTAFENSARSLGLMDAAGAAQGFTITITELNPGSQGLRYLAGAFGAGKGTVMAKVAGEAGSLEAEGELSGGSFGGSFDGVMRALGADVAKAIAAKRASSGQ